MPSIKDLPPGEISDRITWMTRDQGTQVMQYGSGQGEPRAREQICEVMVEESSVVDPDDIVITVGSQQGLDLVIRVFCDPGDVILAESPSHAGVLGTFQSYQTEMMHVACDSEGLTPEALTETAECLKKQGRCIRFLYTIPNLNNSLGVTQPVGQHRRVIESCAGAGVLVVEDNPYGLLTLDSGPLPATRSLDTSMVYLGSFSKTLAPGFRAGWAYAPYGVRKCLALAQKLATLCPPVSPQFATSDYLGNCDWCGQIGVFRSMHRTRRDAVLATLEQEMPDSCSWTRPAGGFFVWVTLPEGLDVSTMLPHGVGACVVFVPGPALSTDRQGSRDVRPSYYFSPPDRTITGVERPAQVLRSELKMLRTSGMHTPSYASPTKGPGSNLD